MGVSTDGIICFGICVVEEASLPWDDFDGDEEEWWREKVLGYKSPYQIFGDDGNWLNGVEAPQEEIDAWYDHKKEFDKSNPQLPVEIVMHCSGNFPMWIIADKELGMSANRGFPKSFDPYEMVDVTDYDKRVQTIEDFVTRWEIEVEGEIGWWLCSLWF